MKYFPYLNSLIFVFNLPRVWNLRKVRRNVKLFQDETQVQLQLSSVRVSIFVNLLLSND
jgi:hypothetical protein